MKKINGIEFAYPTSLMFEADDTFLFGREPTPRRMPDGSIVSLVYTGGTKEPHPDNFAAIIRSTDDGASWSKPEILFKHPFRCVIGTELFTETSRPFAVFQTFCYETFFTELRSFMTFTDDNGKSWSNPFSIPGVPPNFLVRQGKILSDGSWLFPIYWFEQRPDWDWTTCNYGTFFTSGVIRSTDGGKSFSLHGAVRTPGNAYEPEVTELEPGHLKMFMRYEDGGGVLWESDSFDYGLSWSNARPSIIPNPGAKFVIYKIRGRHVLINNICTPKRKERDVLELWVSNDNCASWSKKLPLARLYKEKPNTGGVFFDTEEPLPQVSYPHGFADDKEEKLYLAIDSVQKFFFLKVPYTDFL